MSITICVSGGRKYGWKFDEENHEIENMEETWFLFDILETVREHFPSMKLIHGAAKGADSWAQVWAVNKNILVQRFKAEWDLYGNAAGPIRNGEMVLERPNLVIAFPGRSGTADMVMQATKAGLNVIQVSPYYKEKSFTELIEKLEGLKNV